MFPFKENSHPSSLHSKTPYSRTNIKMPDSIVSKITTKQRTSENNYGRSFLLGKPSGLKNPQILRHYEAPSTSYADADVESLRECETEHFHPRRVHLGNLSLESNFDNIELKMMSIEDAMEAWGNSRKPKPKPQETSPKGFQIKPRQNLLRVFTGSVEDVLHWSKLKNNHHILFEVTATVVGVEQEGKWKTEKIFYLGDSKSGPKLQVLYHEIDRPLQEIFVNSQVNCIGRLITRNRLQAYKVEQSSEQRQNDLQRVSFICNRVADELVAASQTK